MTMIKDGRSSKTLLIDNNNHAHVDSVTLGEADHSAKFGAKFNINTGDITLTDANNTSVLYIKNNEDSDLVITALIYNLGATTSGTGDVKIDVLRNPTTGDIVTNASAVAVGAGVSANQNFGSNVSLSVDAYKGATADSLLTDGAVSISTRSASNTGRIVISLGAVRLPKGSSIAINYTPPSSNSSQIVQFAAACYLATSAVHAES